MDDDETTSLLQVAPLPVTPNNINALEDSLSMHGWSSVPVTPMSLVRMQMLMKITRARRSDETKVLLAELAGLEDDLEGAPTFSTASTEECASYTLDLLRNTKSYINDDEYPPQVHGGFVECCALCFQPKAHVQLTHYTSACSGNCCAKTFQVATCFTCGLALFFFGPCQWTYGNLNAEGPHLFGKIVLQHVRCNVLESVNGPPIDPEDVPCPDPKCGRMCFKGVVQLTTKNPRTGKVARVKWPVAPVWFRPAPNRPTCLPCEA